MEFKREYFLFFLSPLLLVVIGVGMLQIITQRGRLVGPDQRKADLLLQEVMDLVDHEYVIEPDAEDLTYGAAKGIARSLDRYCKVYRKDEWERRKQDDGGRYDGIGIQTNVLRGWVTALKVGRGGPAWRAGMRDGDVLLEVDGWPVERNAVHRDVLDRLEGPRSSQVRIKIRDFHGGEPRLITVTRGTATIESVHGEILDDSEGVGYVRITGFNDNTDNQFNGVLRRLESEGLAAIILDLRSNPGGSLPVAVDIADRFLREGTIVTTLGRNSTVPYAATDNSLDIDCPLVVLVDVGTASAAEVVAGALQDHGRAVVVGERTFGKGVVQGIYSFNYGEGGMKLTIAHYVTPADRCIEKALALGGNPKRRGGLRPDVPLPLTKLERGYARELGNRRRYQPFIRRALAEADSEADKRLPPGFKDPHLRWALQLIAGIDRDLPTTDSDR